jgi:hypothetical protein
MFQFDLIVFCVIILIYLYILDIQIFMNGNNYHLNNENQLAIELSICVLRN